MLLTGPPTAGGSVRWLVRTPLPGVYEMPLPRFVGTAPGTCTFVVGVEYEPPGAFVLAGVPMRGV